MIMPKVPAVPSKRNTELVVNALTNLQETRGSSVKNIMDFIAKEEKMPQRKAKRMIQTTLQRGVMFGAINKKRGGLYKLNEDFMDYVKSHSRRRRRSRRRYSRSRSRRRRRYRPRRRYRRRRYRSRSLSKQESE